jgi:hypothetical protein
MVGIDPAAEWFTGGEGEWRYRILVAASSDMVYRMSADWGEMRGLIGREIIADTGSPSRTWLEEYIHPDDQPTVRQDIDRAIQTKSVFELEHVSFAPMARWVGRIRVRSPCLMEREKSPSGSVQRLMFPSANEGKRRCTKAKRGYKPRSIL